jgi:hypothetical protein
MNAKETAEVIVNLPDSDEGLWQPNPDGSWDCWIESIADIKALASDYLKLLEASKLAATYFDARFGADGWDRDKLHAEALWAAIQGAKA